jgi:hypothetical protein
MQQPKAPKPATVTRSIASKMLGCSRTRVRQFEAEGRLRAVEIDDKGIHHYLLSDLQALVRERGNGVAPDRVHGTIAAQVFKMFREGVELPEIVMQTQQSPMTIRQLYEEYSRPLGHKPSPTVDLKDYDDQAKTLDEKIARLTQRPPIASTRPSSSGVPLIAGGTGVRHARDK